MLNDDLATLTEREAELAGAMQSVLTDARYALGQLTRLRVAANHGAKLTPAVDYTDRAYDALERIVANAEAALVATAEIEVVD